HYLYEPGSFVPVAQALRKSPIRLLRQPDWNDREYDFDQDPLWQHEVKPQPIDAIAWYQCDHLGTPMELTDHNGEVAWTAQYKAWGEIKEARSEWAKQVGLGNPIRFQGQYHDHETGLHYNRYRYYDPRTGRFISQDPISYLGGVNLYQYVPNPIDWIDPWGLARIKNAVDGDRRHQQFNDVIKKKHPNATIQSECYLRDANGKPVKDPVTGERRRVDTAVIENGQATTYEVTSLTADKTDQIQKEQNTRREGGTYIRDRSTKKLIPVVGVSDVVRLP
ncbi:RHS repeat-associated core domain-containing protein, partial [Pseudomonas sp. VA159-2]|uniref:RHS repeat-associated core domain-containing protein n=1 Tax=Pseudomonas sp. VA159-2 TaxID=2956728 RepID=UPI002097F7DE